MRGQPKGTDTAITATQPKRKILKIAREMAEIDRQEVNLALKKSRLVEALQREAEKLPRRIP